MFSVIKAENCDSCLRRKPLKRSILQSSWYLRERIKWRTWDVCGTTGNRDTCRTRFFELSLTCSIPLSHLCVCDAFFAHVGPFPHLMHDCVAIFTVYEVEYSVMAVRGIVLRCSCQMQTVFIITSRIGEQHIYALLPKSLDHYPRTLLTVGYVV